jgi:large subunit ribosomal protein L17
MRHQKNTVKLGRSQAHRDALLANQVCSLIEHNRIKTTLAKAKAVRPLAEKMVTLGKKKTLHARRTALAVLRQADAVSKLFDDVAPRSEARVGGYTRIVKLGQRKSDAAPMAFIEWVDAPVVVEEVIEAPAKKGSKAKATPKTEAAAETAEKPAKKPRAKKTEEAPAAEEKAAE